MIKNLNFIAFLISPLDRDRTIVRVVDAAVAGHYTLVIAQELIAELRHTFEKKPHLARHTEPEQIDRFPPIVFDSSELLQTALAPVVRVTRDPEDDCLLAACAVADIDILVTGDLDLLVLRDRLSRPEIMTAAEFLHLIDSTETN